MHIAYIELQNVKSYEKSGRIEFAKGINAISGQNGAGKSTILEAIGFALSGLSIQPQAPPTYLTPKQR